MDRRRRQQDGAEAQASSIRNTSAPRRSRRQRDKTTAVGEGLPTWTNHHSQYPHHYVRDAAAYIIPRRIDSLAERASTNRPKKKNIWLWGFKDYVIDYTGYEVDRQLRLGLPDLTSERKYRRPTQRLDGSLLSRSEKFFNYAEQMIAYEVEKEIRKYMRQQSSKPSATPVGLPSRQNGAPGYPGQEPFVAGAIAGPSLPHVPIFRWADLDPAQREFLAAALSKRLGRLISENAGDILMRVDEENGTLWGVGHDDLIQRALDKNFSLEDVRQDPGPQNYTDQVDVGRNILRRPATSDEPFRITSNSKASSQTTETRWPTPGALERGEPRRLVPGSLDGSTLDAERADSLRAGSLQTRWPIPGRLNGTSSAFTPARKQKQSKAKAQMPSPSLKQAEPSFGTIFRSLSLRRKKPKEDLRQRTRPSTSDDKGRLMQRQPVADLSLMGSNVVAATSGSCGVMDRVPSPTRTALGGASRQMIVSSKVGSTATGTPSTRPLLGMLRRSGSIRRPRSSKGQKHRHSTSSSQNRPVIPTAISSSIGRDLPETVGLGVSYEEMTAATPPLVQNPSDPSRVLPPGKEEPLRPALLGTAHTVVAERDRVSQLSPIGEVASPITRSPRPTLEAAAAAHGTRTASAPRGARVAAAHDALHGAVSRSSRKPGTQPALSRSTTSQGPESSRPSSGRLAGSATQNPASASAPPKRNLGSRLLDKLDAEKNQKATSSTNVEIHPALRPAPGSSQPTFPSSPSVYSTPSFPPAAVPAPLFSTPTSAAALNRVNDSSISSRTPLKDEQDDELPKWTWPKDIPPAQAGVPTPDPKENAREQTGKGKAKNTRSEPIGGASGGWSFGNL